MPLSLSSKLKLERLQSQIEQLLISDAPFESCSVALRQLRHVVDRYEKRIDDAVSLNQADLIKSAAENINQLILDVLPILGFIVRSTNVRNAFELNEPLTDIANIVLDHKSKLIMSTEWDYIPFAYPIGTEQLPSFTFIGVPVSDAENILIVPLAGHELGHAVWRRNQLNGSVDVTLDNHLQDLYEQNAEEYARYNPRYKAGGDLLNQEEIESSIAVSTDYAARHAEEYFCDLIGLSLFGAAFIRAYAYILAPGMGRKRRPDYPSTLNRAKVLEEYAVKAGAQVPTGFIDKFQNEYAAGSGFELKYAEFAVKRIIPGLWEQAQKFAAKAPRPTSLGSAEILERFRKGTPFSRPKSLSDIVNAAWSRYDDLAAEDIKHARKSEKIDQLNEMALKTVEALEYQQRVSRR